MYLHTICMYQQVSIYPVSNIILYYSVIRVKLTWKIFSYRYKGEMLWHQPLCLSVVTVSIADIDMARLLLVMLLPALAAAAAGDNDVCNPDKMTVYKMVLHTYWTREKFPKHYPDWRPPAQWSKVYGEY